MLRHCKPTSPPKNASPRRLRSSTTAAAKSAAFQKPSLNSQELIDRPRKAQKRKHAAEDEHSQKRLRKDPPSVLVPAAASQDLVGVWQTKGKKRRHESEDEHSYKRRRESVPSQLSKENLKKLERDLEQLEREMPQEMDSVVIVPARGQKRGPSRQQSLSDLNQNTAASQLTQKSSVSNSFYRYHILEEASIFIRPQPPPMDIQAQMDVIFSREISETRRREISDIANEISQRFIKKLRGASREDDLVEILYIALDMMYKDETFDFPRKTGIVPPLDPIYKSLRANVDQDWDPSLKPGDQTVWNLDAFGQPNNKADDIVDRPSKRQQGELSLPSPNISQPIMPPPPSPSQPAQAAVKTPRPDFTIGLRHSKVSNALVELGLSEYKADKFLQVLQRKGKLCSDPTKDFSNIRFPILVIEGKSYATGKTVFEAQNQAAVSGSCMVNLQQQFTDVFENAFPNSKEEKTHLAFSICTEGPHIEFWVHYALTEDRVRVHYMNIFKTCHGSLRGGLEDFLLDVERLMGWTEGEFLKEVADHVFKLANDVVLW